jgi:hypothetical protein
MKLLRTARWLMLALLLPLIPASQARAGVFISVNFGPPVLPVYVQPPCPQPGLMWTPGYWAYGGEGYYWVPGAWVPAPYEGALWTPGYWGWSGGLYIFHGGYWGRHVGYYGGVNYGFGYMGMGFAGGEWRGHEFAYNTAIINVNRTVIHNTYENVTIVKQYTIVNDKHVAYSGGPGGISHQPTPQEQTYMHEQHVAPTSFQQQHIQAASTNKSSYAKNNGGKPQTLAVEKPLPAAHVQPPAANMGAHGNTGAGAHAGATASPQGNHPGAQPGKGAGSHPGAQPGTGAGSHSAQQHGQQPEPHPGPPPGSHPGPGPQSQPHPGPSPQGHPAQQQPKQQPKHPQH